jgi:hypothetical protein
VTVVGCGLGISPMSRRSHYTQLVRTGTLSAVGASAPAVYDRCCRTSLLRWEQEVVSIPTPSLRLCCDTPAAASWPLRTAALSCAWPRTRYAPALVCVAVTATHYCQRWHGGFGDGSLAPSLLGPPAAARPGPIILLSLPGCSSHVALPASSRLRAC